MHLRNLIYRQQTILFFVLLFVLTLVLYYCNLQAFFVSDDFEWLAVSINRNPLNFFVTNYAGASQGGSFGPLVNLVYYLAYQWGRLNPLYYHLFSLFFHFANIVLFYLVIKKLFSSKIAIISALLFTVYFNNAEVVAWIAAIPHLLSTFFFLLTIYSYLLFQEKQKIFIYGLSLVFFALALLAKEIALSLPLVILLLSWIRDRQSKIYFNKKQVFYLVGAYLVVLLFYLYWRYQTTGILFGYYGRSQLDINPKAYLENFYYLLLTFFSSGYFRIFLFSIIKNQLKIILPISLLIGGGLIYILRQKIKIILPYVLLFLVVLIPYLSLAPNPLNNEGERYVYLPALFLIPILAYFIARWHLAQPRLLMFLLALIFISSAYLLYQKNKIWSAAAQISENIVLEFGQKIDTQKDSEIYFVYLPDNLQGAQVLRNAVEQAIDLYYPDHKLKIKSLPIHVLLNKDNKAGDLFVWEKRDKANQFLGHTTNKEKLITGPQAAYYGEDLVFELWGYNYDTYLTDRIFFELKDKLLEQSKDKSVYFLYYNQGVLQILNDNI